MVTPPDEAQIVRVSDEVEQIRALFKELEISSCVSVLKWIGNARQRGVDWPFKVGDAHVKLKSVYPKIIV